MAVQADPALTAAIGAFLDELQVERGLSPLTVAAYRRDLAQFAAAAGRSWRNDPEPVRDFVNALRREGRRSSTQARKVAAIRSFYGFALREELAERDVAALLDAPKAGSYLPDVLGSRGRGPHPRRASTRRAGRGSAIGPSWSCSTPAGCASAS